MIYLFFSIIGKYVSLPGAGAIEQSTILQVFNHVNTDDESKSNATTTTATSDAVNGLKKACIDEHEIDSSISQNNINAQNVSPSVISADEPVAVRQSSIQSDSLVSSFTKEPSDNQILDNKNISLNHQEQTSTLLKLQEVLQQPLLQDQQTANVLDIESHLIETYKDLYDKEDSVRINELPPIKAELTLGSSKVDSENNSCSIIEVEPVGSIGKQPVQTVVEPQGPKQFAKLKNCASETETEFETKFESTTETGFNLELLKCKEIRPDIQATAEKLVEEIEQQVLEAIRGKIGKANEGVATEDTTLILEELPKPNNISEEVAILPKEEAESHLSIPDINSNIKQKNSEEHIPDLTSILKPSPIIVYPNGANGQAVLIDIDQTDHSKNQQEQFKLFDLNCLPSPKTVSEEEERKLFIESLPQIAENSDARKLAADCKREYYQSLRKYLVQSSTDKPPVPLQTYRWEDLRRAKERGGYPWTHLYKRPLGDDEEPELVLLLRKSQELRFTSESPKSLKKVHYDEQVLVKETERYIQELSEEEEIDDHNTDSGAPTTEDEDCHSLHSESISCVSDSVLAVGKPRKSKKLGKLRGILKKRKSGRSPEDSQSLPGTSVNNSCHQSKENLNQQTSISPNINEHKSPRCFSIMKKLRNMADRQKKRLNIKRISLKKDDQIVLNEETKIMRLKSSPKSERGEIPHFIEKQDSDDIDVDVLEIVELDESPSRKRKDDGRDTEEREIRAINASAKTSVVQPDEIIEITNNLSSNNASHTPEPTVPGILENDKESIISPSQDSSTVNEPPPRKAPRLRREHVYEEIDQIETVGEQINQILEIASVEALKSSLTKQDDFVMRDLEAVNKPIPLDRMGSSEEEQITAVDTKPSGANLLAPISSIDSTSSDEDRTRSQLSPVAEESDVASVDVHINENTTAVNATNNFELNESNNSTDLKPSIKKEPSPAPSDKKVTFSHVEDEAEPHREDIELPLEVVQQAAEKRWKNMSDHEYEPIGEPLSDEKLIPAKESSPVQHDNLTQHQAHQEEKEIEELQNEMQIAEELQKDIEDRYFSSVNTTPRTESRTDYEIHTSQVDSSTLEELPLKPENRRKGFMASAQDRTRKMQAGIKTQAGKIRTKLRSPTKKPLSDSPKAKERKKFKAPEFSKMKLPEIKRPDMSKLKDFKRPEFTKFNKPDMSKFKLPEKFSTLKVRRSKSFKENEPVHNEVLMDDATTKPSPNSEAPPKKIFDFHFGTYPRAFRRNKKPVEQETSVFTGTGTATEEPSVIPSTETQPSLESSSSPQGDRGPGPVRSRWADKFSDVSYNDSEGSRYRRYGSEQESFDRESSLERRMREDLEEAPSEEANLGILGGVTDNRQFADFDEENRAIHEISNLRAGEFKRRPMVHQDSDLVSEESKDAVGWTDKEIQKNKLLRKAELEAEASYFNYPSEERITQDAQSTASSGKKVVMEEIDDDEFFLRKRGVSEDNIQIRQYISSAIREGFDTPINALQHVGRTNQPIDYGDYDVPPPKPRRLHKTYGPEEESQEFEMRHTEFEDDISLSQNGSGYFNAPKRPMRKGRSRSKYSMDSQDQFLPATSRQEQYFDDDEEYLRPPHTDNIEEEEVEETNKLNILHKVNELQIESASTRPEAPRRRKRHQRETSMDKNSYINGFGGRSVSHSYLQTPEDVIVYRTEHEYHLPLATPENYTDGTSATSHKSQSISRYEDDDRTSRGAESFAMDQVMRVEQEAEVDSKDMPENRVYVQDKFIIDMMENDGYAVVRKEHLPKPTPPARRKKFSRSPGERFATMPNMRIKQGSPAPPERPPPPIDYTHPEPIASLQEPLEEPQNIESDYEELQNIDDERPESPRNLQSGDIINKMKYRPLPPPPRPPREKRQRGDKGLGQELEFDDETNFDDRDGGGERIASSSTADSTDFNSDFDAVQRFVEVEVSTQTDPLPDDFVCEEFEITDDMKVIEPREPAKTLRDMLDEENLLSEDEQLARGLQKFRDANQRSISEKSRASSKSQSRPQTPSAVVVERRVSTPIPNRDTTESMLEAALIVHPIDDLDLEEEALRREGLLTDSSQQSKSDKDSRYQDEEPYKTTNISQHLSSDELEEALEGLRSQQTSILETEDDSVQDTEDDKEVERTIGEHIFQYSRVEEEILRRLKKLDEEEEQLNFNQKQIEISATELQQPKFIEAETSPSEEQPPLVLTENKIETIATELQLPKSMELETSPSVDETPLVLTEHKLRDEIQEDIVKIDYEQKLATEPLKPEPEKQIEISKDTPYQEETHQILPQVQPQPPPRRRSSATIDPSMQVLLEQPKLQELATQLLEPTQPSYPTHMTITDLEVEHLRVHAMQAGQIMVSQLHGNQISADDLECKSGNLIINNIELPSGFIENIVERVRSSERSQLHVAETQTSRQASDEALSIDQTYTQPVLESIPPPKPPRQRVVEGTTPSLQSPPPPPPPPSETPLRQQIHDVHEDTTDQTTQTLESSASATATPLQQQQPPNVFPTIEYLQSLAPLAFYNLRNLESDVAVSHRHHHRHHRRSRESSTSADGDDTMEKLDSSESLEQVETKSHRHRTRSATKPEEPQSVAKAGRQFLSACSLSLVNIINQLTDSIRAKTATDLDSETRERQVPPMVVFFIVLTFVILLFLLSGKSIHHHHWDFFNPPGNNGRIA